MKVNTHRTKDYTARNRASRLTWLTSAEAAAYCCASPAKFSIMVAEIPIPFICPLGPKSHRLFNRQDIDKALRSRTLNTPVGMLPV